MHCLLPHTDGMSEVVMALRSQVQAAIELVELCKWPDAARWFREKDLILAAPDVDGSHLATATTLAASSAGMGRPLEVVEPRSDSGLSPEEAENRRDLIIDAMTSIRDRMLSDPR